jgi:hypothetical protein
MRAAGVFALLAAICQGPEQNAPVCARQPGSSPAAWVDVAAPRPQDSLMVARVCVMPANGAARIASYNGEVVFDSLAATLLSHEHPGDGLRAVNQRVRGTVAFAGAAASGFTAGAVLTMRLRLATRGKAPELHLRITELNDSTGTSLLARARIESHPPGAAAACDTASPRLTSIVPATIDLTAGDMTPIVIRGCGFSSTNTLRIGPVTFTRVAATDAGTRIAFVVPQTIPSNSEVPPRQMPTGLMEVVVTTGAASSNRGELRIK